MLKQGHFEARTPGQRGVSWANINEVCHRYLYFSFLSLNSYTLCFLCFLIHQRQVWQRSFRWLFFLSFFARIQIWVNCLVFISMVKWFGALWPCWSVFSRYALITFLTSWFKSLHHLVELLFFSWNISLMSLTFHLSWLAWLIAFLKSLSDALLNYLHHFLD